MQKTGLNCTYDLVQKYTFKEIKQSLKSPAIILHFPMQAVKYFRFNKAGVPGLQVDAFLIFFFLFSFKSKVLFKSKKNKLDKNFAFKIILNRKTNITFFFMRSLLIEFVHKAEHLVYFNKNCVKIDLILTEKNLFNIKDVLNNGTQKIKGEFFVKATFVLLHKFKNYEKITNFFYNNLYCWSNVFR